MVRNGKRNGAAPRHHQARADAAGCHGSFCRHARCVSPGSTADTAGCYFEGRFPFSCPNCSTARTTPGPTGSSATRAAGSTPRPAGHGIRPTWKMNASNGDSGIQGHPPHELTVGPYPR